MMKALSIMLKATLQDIETVEMTNLPRGKSRRITLDDVASRAKVSAVTASRVLRKPEMVSADLRARVDSAVRELAYIPNQLASALASSRTRRIGVIVPSLTNGVFGDYLRALHDVFIPAGFQVLVLNSHYLPGREEKAIATMLGQFPEAIILAGHWPNGTGAQITAAGRHSRCANHGDDGHTNRHQYWPFTG